MAAVEGLIERSGSRLRHYTEGKGVPLLAITGSHDFIVPPSLWQAHPAPFRAMTWHCLERCGHTPQLEVAEEFERHLLAWLQGEVKLGF